MHTKSTSRLASFIALSDSLIPGCACSLVGGGQRIKPPPGLEIVRRRLPQQTRTHHFYRHRATAQDGVVKLAVAHLAAANQLALQRLQLQATEQITGLIQRRIIAGKADRKSTRLNSSH